MVLNIFWLPLRNQISLVLGLILITKLFATVIGKNVVTIQKNLVTINNATKQFIIIKMFLCVFLFLSVYCNAYIYIIYK